MCIVRVKSSHFRFWNQREYDLRAWWINNKLSKSLLIRFDQIVWCDEHVGTFSIFKGTLGIFEEETQTQNLYICNINDANAEIFIFSIT